MRIPASDPFLFPILSSNLIVSLKSQADPKQRLDHALVSRGLAVNREQAHRYILAGLVKVDGMLIDKRAKLIGESAKVSLDLPATSYVSRAGDKLASGIDAFGIDCQELTAMDIGSSTGGFTDCLLQHGASRVYAVDVGYGQLDWKIREDPRVIVHERCNIRYLAVEEIPDPIDLVVIDVSFISLRIVLPCAIKFLGSAASVLMLLKPQFEVGKGQVGRGGIVRDENKRMEVRDDLLAYTETLGFSTIGVMDSPVLGRKGNKEILIALKAGANMNDA